MILTGLPGSGKSTVGRQLARRLTFSFVDTDQLIEQRLGCSIREYFEREGEEAFRDVEQAVLAEVLAQKDSTRVIATGGGIILRPANRQLLKQHTVIYLAAQPEDLVRRLQHDRTRPLMQTQQPMQRLQELLAMREPLYREVARYTVESGRKSATTVVYQILNALEH